MRHTSLSLYRKSLGFTLVELLVVIAIIGILIAMLLPAIQASRESARRLSCVNNMNQIGMALTEWESANGHFPSGVLDKKGPILNRPEGRQVGWMVQILPYLEESVAYNMIDQEKGIFDKANQPVRSLPISVFCCPSNGGNMVLEENDYSMYEMGMGMPGGGMGMPGGMPGMGGEMDMGGGMPGGMPGMDEEIDAPEPVVEETPEEKTEAKEAEEQDTEEEAKPPTRGTRAVSCYAACCNGVEASIDADMQGIFFLNSQVTRDAVTDGLTHTLLVGEKLVPDNDLGWMSGSCATLRNTSQPPHVTRRDQYRESGNLDESVVGGFNAEHPTVCNLLFADGVVRAVSLCIDTEVYKLYGSRADGKLITTGPTRE